jgi:hypothetical protein
MICRSVIRSALCGAALLVTAAGTALAASQMVADALKTGADDSTACLSPDPKAGLKAFQDCTKKHVQAPPGSGSARDSYLLGLNGQSWAMVNLQSLKAWDAGAKGTETEKAEAMKAANVLQDAAHGYFLEMRKLQKKLSVTDPALCDALGLPYDVLQDHFRFYDQWK